VLPQRADLGEARRAERVLVRAEPHAVGGGVIGGAEPPGGALGDRLRQRLVGLDRMPPTGQPTDLPPPG
jgi:hypothetical protein